MHKEEEEAAHYEQEELEALELMWGESFLSPGGPEEVAAVLAGLDLRGREVLDIGCGLGGVTALLVTAHGAAHVTALDVEPRMVAGTLATIRKAGLHERVTVVQSRPGPLPAHDASFDVVFSKDSLIHIRDKEAMFREVLRVLRPGGLFVGSDWLRSAAPGPALAEWTNALGNLDFTMVSGEATQALLEHVGFQRVELRDRKEWFKESSARDVRTIETHYDGIVSRHGKAAADRRLAVQRLEAAVAAAGDLCPTHFRAYRPQ